MRHGQPLSSIPILLMLLGCGSDDSGYERRLAEEHRADTPSPTAAAEVAPAQAVKEDLVAYAVLGGRPISGYLARPATAGEPLAGLIVIHEWWGLNDQIRAMTRRLAGEGYLALAVDLYEGQVAPDVDRAHELVQAARKQPGRIEDNLRQAYSYLSERERASEVGTIGWCFGGGWSLNAALLLPDQIDATVIYYGRLETDPKSLEPLAMPILGIFGEKDESIPVATVRSFEAALRALGKEVEIHIYPAAGHAFANSSGERYQPQAAEDAWKVTLAFLGRHLGRSKESAAQ